MWYEEEEEILIALILLHIMQQHNSARNQRYLLKEALVTPKQSPWFKLYDEADDHLFLTMTGFNRMAFDYIQNTIHAAYVENYNIPTAGRSH